VCLIRPEWYAGGRLFTPRNASLVELLVTAFADVAHHFSP
jgi:hypothetical protein